MRKFLSVITAILIISLIFKCGKEKSGDFLSALKEKNVEICEIVW